MEPPRFTCIEEIGRGAMGVVYRAWDERFRCEVALKRLAMRLPGELSHLKSEFRRVSTLAHRNLAAMHELVVEDDQAYFTMELVPGGRLDRTQRGLQKKSGPSSGRYSKDSSRSTRQVSSTGT